MEKLKLGNLPTRIEKLKGYKEILGRDIYIKRDDETGVEVSGNKIRKLEYALKEALDMGATHILTCGGHESNHVRATIAASIKVGLKAIVFLRGDKKPRERGNLFLDEFFGCEINYIEEKLFNKRKSELMSERARELQSEGKKGYIIPMGASFGIGNFGYRDVIFEIEKQEKELGVFFDTIVVPMGSGGTYAGLVLGEKQSKVKRKVVGVPICDTREIFLEETLKILEESNEYLEKKETFQRGDLNITRDYKGRGYSLSTKEELKFIVEFGRREGIILDPTYTGKAFIGMVEELQNGELKESKNVLFIHTGGVYSLFSKESEIREVMEEI